MIHRLTMACIAALLVLSVTAFGQTHQAPRIEDVASMDAILAALYDVISGPAGQKRDWGRMRSLFLDGGHMVGTGRRPDGGLRPSHDGQRRRLYCDERKNPGGTRILRNRNRQARRHLRQYQPGVQRLRGPFQKGRRKTLHAGH